MISAFQNAYIDYILGEVHDLAITVQNLPSDQSRLQLTITHPNITGFRKGWEHLSNLINSVCITQWSPIYLYFIQGRLMKDYN